MREETKFWIAWWTTFFVIITFWVLIIIALFLGVVYLVKHI
jgi:hypothetical protein